MASSLASKAQGGERALHLLAERTFDLVLLDVMMPGLNGYQVLERMRADKDTRDIPVIMISALDEIESVVRCIELGAEDHLPKTFNATLLRARIGASLERNACATSSCVIPCAWSASSRRRVRSS